MAKQVEAPELTKEQNAFACGAIETEVSAMLKACEAKADSETVREVAKVLGYLDGKRGKNDGSQFASVVPTVRGLRWAIDIGGAEIPSETVGVVVEKARFEFLSLMAEKDKLIAQLAGYDTAIAATPEGPGREALVAKRNEAQETIKSVRRKLDKHADAMREYARAQREALENSIAGLTAEVSALETAAKNAPSLANLLQVKRNDLSHAQGKLASMPTFEEEKASNVAV